jgi:hypothetical protein
MVYIAVVKCNRWQPKKQTNKRTKNRTKSTQHKKQKRRVLSLVDYSQNRQTCCVQEIPPSSFFHTTYDGTLLLRLTCLASWILLIHTCYKNIHISCISSQPPTTSKIQNIISIAGQLQPLLLQVALATCQHVHAPTSLHQFARVLVAFRLLWCGLLIWNIMTLHHVKSQ